MCTIFIIRLIVFFSCDVGLIGRRHHIVLTTKTSSKSRFTSSLRSRQADRHCSHQALPFSKHFLPDDLTAMYACVYDRCPFHLSIEHWLNIMLVSNKHVYKFAEFWDLLLSRNGLPVEITCVSYSLLVPGLFWFSGLFP